ncbi:hypothetical protein IW261DRAFT_1593514 [Armillaria novae-zelandiae]|uniref:DUF6534 domain-containing protein n=1 Tax=Armillaria novae-zelandiae TaxID=153914 RepID=A0AA39UFK4_9AGAR|nr:hypothetical protein IW261DRAFT_1593514 [Armillaria novae-zelandiae]
MPIVPTGQPTELPAFDNTLGVLYIGSSLATALYGVICVQTFLYVISNRTRSDGWPMRLLVSILFSRTHLNCSGLDTAQQSLTVAGMYRFLVSDYANPAALAIGGSTSGRALTTYDEGIVGISGILLVQLFFCWRIWTFSASSLHLHVRIAIIALAVALAFLNLGQWDNTATAVMILGLTSSTFQYAASSIALSIFGYRHRFLTANTPEFTLSWKLSASSGIAFDVITTMAMILSLYRSRSGMKRSNHVITILMLFTVNTNLVTTFLSIGSLVTYLVLPDATIYGGITFLLSKSYLNSFLAILNTREYLREKMERSSQSEQEQSSVANFAGPSTSTDVLSTAGEPFELSLVAAIGSSTSKV